MAIEEDEIMMKKWTSLLLVLMMLFTGVAVAEEAETPVTATITLSVLDKEGNAIAGANVTVFDDAWETVDEFVTDGQPYVAEDLAEGFYTVRLARN